jgi:hypothetical protein
MKKRLAYFNRFRKPANIIHEFIVLWYIQDVYEADINRHLPGSNIILASYLSGAGEVHLITANTMYFELNLVELIWTPIKLRRVILNYVCHLPVFVPRLCLLTLHTNLE